MGQRVCGPVVLHRRLRGGARRGGFGRKPRQHGVRGRRFPPWGAGRCGTSPRPAPSDHGHRAKGKDSKVSRVTASSSHVATPLGGVTLRVIDLLRAFLELDTHDIGVGRCLTGDVVGATYCVVTMAASGGVGLLLSFGSRSHPACSRGCRASLCLPGVGTAEAGPCGDDDARRVVGCGAGSTQAQCFSPIMLVDRVGTAW